MKKYNYKVSPDCLDAFVDEDFSQSEIARCCSVSRQAINQRIHESWRRRKVFSKPKHRLAGWLFWRNKGFNLTEIAEITDSNITTVFTRFRNLGIHCVHGERGRPLKGG